MIRHLWLLALFCTPAFADEDAYHQCILTYQRQAKEGQAVYLIEQACNKLHNEGSFLFEREKAYYRCLLENLPGVEHSFAVQKIRSACNEINN
ncbi:MULTISPECIES: VF_A0006 family four-cysteine protein [Pseudomonas]|uniref:Uncharacterized protein n=1 Tax=Pseudomonas indica TaxID=137658 RepID=A0A1G9GXU0_9PSED|nr:MULTISPECIES: VF_A0006 family four-cysteine protein [Pseudomonas]MBU3056787.1 hypothetical protein [Pseudomonas indica]PAU58422.1 hypothetical protein BZL41_18065 [Pseudomonas sp. PIC25]PAU60160.1 hypothetical protein BZL42_10740 [Pseudomonas indica]SDL05489.1 hypothetical protein SAMN05216186_11442 [Pseudomonas indica]